MLRKPICLGFAACLTASVVCSLRICVRPAEALRTFSRGSADLKALGSTGSERM